MRFFLITAFILILGVFNMLEPLRSGYQFVTTPIQLGLFDLAKELKNSVLFFSQLSDIRKENLALRAQIQDLTSKNLELKVIAEENKILKNQLAIKNKGDFDKKLLLASVMGNPADLSNSTLIIDKGFRHGVAVGDNVIIGRFLVGMVKQVSSERSVVTLITSSDSSVTVYDTDSQNRTGGLAVGQFGTAVLLKRILPNEELKVGDRIVSSGKDGFYEAGLFIGTIREIVYSPSETLKSAYLDLVADFVKLDKVFVILK